MPKTTPRRISAQPSLVLRGRQELICGFAPRTLLLSRFHDALFVGCKDGSVTVVERASEEPHYKPHPIGDHNATTTSIRALCELDRGTLLLGRTDGTLTRCHWQTDPLKEIPVLLSGLPQQPIRSIDWLDEGSLFVSFRGGRCFKLPLGGGDGQLSVMVPLEIPPERGVQQVFSLQGRAGNERSMILLTERGDILTWDGEHEPQPARFRWPGGTAPATPMDSRLERGEPSRLDGSPAKAFFQANHDGVLRFTLQDRALHPEPVPLHGLGSLPTSLAYTETSEHCFLWVADLRGCGHLYWRARGDELSPFQRVGVLPTENQALFGVLRPGQVETELLLIGEACRNDRIILSTYCPCELPVKDGSPDSQWRLRRLLGHGTCEDLKNYLIAQEKKRAELGETREDIDWGAIGEEEVLVEFFEKMRTEPQSRRVLFESLQDPHAKLADSILSRIADSEPAGASGPGRREEARRIVQLWTLSLLGVIHRHPGDREAAYLGLLNWLRQRQRCLLEREDMSEMVEVLEHSIRFARKWGLLGDSGASREEITSSIGVLKRQEHDSGDRPEETSTEYSSEPLERLTYDALLFERGVNEIARDASGRMHGRTAWDIAILDMDGWRLAAVSWRWGGVELYEVRDTLPKGSLALRFFLVPREESGRYRLEPLEYDPREARRLERIRRVTYGYCRAVLLSKVGDRPFLVTNVAFGSDDATEYLTAWELDCGADGLATVRHASELELAPSDTVYSFLDLARRREGAFLAGLQGREGIPELLSAVVEPESGTLTLRRVAKVKLEPAERVEDVAHGPAGRNRVWGMAADSAGLRVFAGCEDGRVLEWRLSERPEDLAKPEVALVATLSSPVLTIACREAKSSLDEKVMRVFAGGEDGSMTCWQEIPGGGGAGSRYASLWATSEEGEVSSIALVGRPAPAVLFITREGRSVFFYDHLPGAAYGKEADHPVRIPFPGCRYGRPDLRGTAFASARVCEPDPDPAGPDPHQPLLVLLTASADGTLRLLGIHSPRFSAERHEHYKRILNLWRKLTREEYQWRLGEAVYRATPALGLVLVRFLLEPEGGAGSQPNLAQLRGSSRWSLPRHLRPLRRFLELWDDTDEAKKPEEGAGKHLELALRRAWQLGDLPLFQEIATVALKRANYLLFQTVQRGRRGLGEEDWLARKRHVGRLYASVLAAVRRGLQRWIGSDGSQEARARMTVASNLVDGDTALKVFQEAARETVATNDRRPFTDILRERGEGIRQLVFKRHPLVSLEAIRAANLALLRACHRLCRARGNYQRPSVGDELLRHEIHWPVISRFFEQVMAVAARTVRSRLRLTDSLAHEFSRTFALAVCACPSATVRIVNRMAESQLMSDPDSPDDVSHRVMRQIEVLATQGVATPSWSLTMFRLAARPPEQGEDPLAALRRELRDVSGPSDAAVQARYGMENTEDLHCLFRIYEVAGYFRDLADRLASDAQDLNVTTQRITGLPRFLADPTVMKLYRHSAAFWRECLEKLGQLALPQEESGRIIRPEMLLFSKHLGRWAGDSVRDLDRKYRQREIFQPEFTVFKRILSRLQEAAAALPRSAAMQKNLVVGILGHHLLEDLDEHVLELEEIAQTLSPSHETSRPEATTADRFASYLVFRAGRAAEIPKNLRSLHSLVEEPPGAPSAGMPGIPLSTMIGPIFTGGLAMHALPTIPASEAHFLGLVFNELAENHRKYGPDSPPEFTWRKPRLEMRFPVHAKDLENLQKVRAVRLQQPLVLSSPDHSSGMGLYLANLVAAVANWELSIDEIVGNTDYPSMLMVLHRHTEL